MCVLYFKFTIYGYLCLSLVILCVFLFMSVFSCLLCLYLVFWSQYDSVMTR